jgi:hypothetical protein
MNLNTEGEKNEKTLVSIVPEHRSFVNHVRAHGVW